ARPRPRSPRRRARAPADERFRPSQESPMEARAFASVQHRPRARGGLPALCLAACGAFAIPAHATGLADLGDEFNDASSLAAWSRFDQVYGWPDKSKRLDIDASTPGALHLQPYDSAWVRDLHAPYLFKMVEGDF